jgi:hypothetical protein
MPTYETKTTETIPADKYTVEIDSIEECVSPPPYNTEQLRISFLVVDNEDYDNRKLAYFCGRGIGKKYSALWAAFNVDAKNKTLDTDKLYGKKCYVMVGVESNKTTGDPFNKILSLVAIPKAGAKKGEAPAAAAAAATEVADDPFADE